MGQWKEEEVVGGGVIVVAKVGAGDGVDVEGGTCCCRCCKLVYLGAIEIRV